MRYDLQILELNSYLKLFLTNIKWLQDATLWYPDIIK